MLTLPELALQHITKKGIIMNKYTLAQILEAWTAAYGEDMQEEYSGFIQKLKEEEKNKTIQVTVQGGVVVDVKNLPEGWDLQIIDKDNEKNKT